MPFYVKSAVEVERIRAGEASAAGAIPEIEAPRYDVLSGTRDIGVNHDGPWKHTKPFRMTLGPWRFSTNSWADAIRMTCDIISVEHRKDFDWGARTIYGPRRHDYFATTAQRKSHKILKSPLFVEIGLSANNAAELIMELAHRFGYERPNIEAPPRTNS